MKRTIQNGLGTLMVLILAVSAAYSANFGGLRDAVPPPTRFVDAAAIDRDPATTNDAHGERSLRSFPWWAPVATFRGEGATRTSEFKIDDFALQWRANWRCDDGRLGIRTIRADGEFAGDVADASCPSEGKGLSVQVGRLALDVAAEAGWEVVVEQQVDVPLVEPLTPAMEDGRVVATGELYDMDRNGSGTVAVYRLRNGSHMLRLEDFYLTPNVDLEIRLSAARRPKTTKEFVGTSQERVAMMPVTTGSINYAVPESVDLDEWRSIVIWCEPLQIAYAAAPLNPST